MHKILSILRVGISSLLVLFATLSISAQSVENFFEFRSTLDDTNILVQETEDSLLVLQGLRLADGYYQIGHEEVKFFGPEKTKILPSLPTRNEVAVSTYFDGHLYVIADHQLLCLNVLEALAKWEVIAVVPSEMGVFHSLVASTEGLFLIGAGSNETYSYAYNLQQGLWQHRAAAPFDLSHHVATPCGHDHILYFNQKTADKTIFSYHKATDSWIKIGELPNPCQVVAVGSSGTEFTLYGKTQVLSGTAVLKATKYGWVDHLVVVLLIGVLVGVGLYCSQKEKSSGDYFRGGQKIPWWAAGLSFFATGASAISLMAMPGKAFAENWIYFSSVFFVIIIQLPLAVWVYIPVARRLKIPTANDYLERRFGLAARMLGFVSYSLNQMLGRMASILLLPALAISAIFGMEMQYSILIMGVVTTIFVTMGGLEAVIWTDVLQAIIMLVAVLVCFGFALVALDLGATDSMALLTNLDKLKMFDFRWDWQAPVVIVLFLNLFASVLGMIGDQNFIQRVQCTPSEKESRKMLYTALAVAIPMNFFLFALGTILFLFYATRAESLSPALKSDSIFPFFAAQNLPAGLAGFVVVALLAATISTVSSAMNSVANLGVEDIYRRFSKSATDQQCLKVGRILTLALGVFGTGSALLLANMSDLKSIWDLFIMITGMVLAPITGIFVLGIFTRRANNYGIWSGTITAILANCYVKYQMDLHPMVYIVVGVFSCVIIGYIVSLLTPKIEKNLEGLTVFSLLKK